MFSYKLINRYAIALLEIAEEKKILPTIYSNAVDFVRICKENRNFQHLLKNPVFLGKTKLIILKGLFADKYHEIFMTFINIVIDRNREILLKEIFVEFIKLYKRSQGIVEAEVITAVPLEEQLFTGISEQIIRLSGFPKVELTNKVDENIIGGFILKFDNKYLDVSVADKLQQVKKQIT
jgi:F-type H+-transporting ATPase subunit delta